MRLPVSSPRVSSAGRVACAARVHSWPSLLAHACAPIFPRSSRSIRQHANTFNPSFLAPPVDLMTGAAWCAPAPTQLPLHVEIGCGAGHWLAAVAAARRDFAHVGFETRVDPARRAAELLRSTGLTNASVCISNPLLSWPHAFPTAGIASAVSLLHPDPHYKLRHTRRRVLSSHLSGVHVMAWVLREGGTLLLQTDLPFLHEWMLAQVAAGRGAAGEPWFEPAPTLVESPWGVPTARERLVVAQGGVICRAAFRRTAVACGRPPQPVAPAVQDGG